MTIMHTHRSKMLADQIEHLLRDELAGDALRAVAAVSAFVAGSMELSQRGRVKALDGMRDLALTRLRISGTVTVKEATHA